MPTEFLRCFRHVVSETAAPQWRHGVFTAAGAFEDVAPWVDLALQIAGFPGNSDFVLNGVVERLQILVGEGPVFQRAAFGNCARAVATNRLRPGLKVPRLETPGLRPVVYGGPANGVHHGRGSSLTSGLCGIRANRGNLTLHFGNGGDAVPSVVVDFVGMEILVRIHPCARFNSGDFQTRPDERQNSHATRRAETHHRHIDRLQINGHVRHLAPRSALVSIPPSWPAPGALPRAGGLDTESGPNQRSCGCLRRTGPRTYLPW